MIWMMVLALAGAVPEPAPAASPAQAGPSKEAKDLGLRLARANTLTAVAPVLAAQQVEEVVRDHPEWTPEDATFYRKTARRVAESDFNRLISAIGDAYARDLSIADLKFLVSALESPAAARRRAIEPTAMREAVDQVGSTDFKSDTLRAFCAQMGKGCPKN